jgi:large subunit ribosomal protein L5
MSTLKELYNDKIKKELMEEFKYSSVMQVPKLEKIVINMGVGEASHDEKFIEAAAKDLETITGQHAVITKAKKAIAGFKVREGQPIGCKVTLRGEKMYNFMEKLIKVALPRVRDFRGISSKAFDGFGNYTLGIKEQLIFPEIVYDDVLKVRGMDIVFVTTAETNDEALALLKGFGMPFRK